MAGSLGALAGFSDGAMRQPEPESEPTMTVVFPVGSSIEEVYGVEAKRWAVLIFYSLYGFSNQLQYVGFSTIVRETQEYVGISAIEVNVLSIMIPVIYCLLALPGCLLYDRLGLRYGMAAGASVNALGAILKFISVWVPHFAWLIVGQILVALGQVLFLGLPPLVAATWFVEAERGIATAVATLSGFAGMAVGMFYAPYVVSSAEQWRFAVLLSSHLVVSLFSLLGIIVVVGNGPRLKPCITASHSQKALELGQVLKRQLRNCDVVLLGIAFGCATGVYTAVSAVLSQILEPFGISERRAGTVAFIGIMLGAANCVAVGLLIDRLRRYKVPLLVLWGVALVFLLVLLVLMNAAGEQMEYAAYVIIAIIELLALPSMPCTMEFAVELTFPDEESVASTLMLLSMCCVSFVGMLVFSVILGDHPTQKRSAIVLGIAAASNTLSIVLLLFVRERRLRLQEEYSRLADAGLLGGSQGVASPNVAATSQSRTPASKEATSDRE